MLAHTTDFDKKGQGKGNGACCTPMELGISCGGVIYCRANTTDRCIIASASNLHAYSRPLVLFVRARAADTDSKTGNDGRPGALAISHAADYGAPGGCSYACHAGSKAAHPGGSGLACSVVHFVQGQNTCRCANRAATRRCRNERWLCYFWEWNQLVMRNVQPGALHGWDKHVLPSCAMRLLSSTHDFACATGLGMAQAGTSALGREEALQTALLLLRLYLGCLQPVEACRRQSAPGAPRQE